jgi:hypothetical protein
VLRLATPCLSLMPHLITALYGLAALLGAAFAAVELRMLIRFLRNRTEIRAGTASRGGASASNDDREAPSVTIQLPLYNERTAADRIIRAAADNLSRGVFTLAPYPTGMRPSLDAVPATNGTQFLTARRADSSVLPR